MIVLDPHISYEGMKLSYVGEESLAAYLESSKKNLHEYHKTCYTDKHTMPLQVTDSMPGASANASAPCSPQKKIFFTSCFQWKAKVAINELDEFFKLPQEDFKTCDPIYWWFGRCAQFPNLFWLAQDILCIPGCVLHCY